VSYDEIERKHTDFGEENRLNHKVLQTAVFFEPEEDEQEKSDDNRVFFRIANPVFLLKFRRI
jgi:hypothetical protein